LRRSFGCSMEASIAPQSENPACFITHSSGAGPSTQDVWWHIRPLLVHFKQHHGAAAFGWRRRGVFYFDYVLHPRPLIHKNIRFFSLINLIRLHDE
jgi:hypothetical protein